jgi:peptide/nickel transport system substrate-binding protein
MHFDGRFKGLAFGALAVALVLASCAPASAPSGASSSGETSSRTPKRIVAGIIGAPPNFARVLNPSGTRGGDALEQLVNAGLTQLDGQGELIPQLAESVPSVNAGSWVVHPDGRMETTWKIKPSASWHDGAPVTSADAVFTMTVWDDDAMPMFRHTARNFVDSVRAPDERTVVISWKQPYIDADRVLNAPLLPRHLLERSFQEDKAGFLELPYWSSQFIGTGPYRLRNWELGSGTLLTSNDSYILGRPKIDDIDVRFYLDNDALIAGLLSGAVDVTIGRTLTSDQGLEVRDRWQEGTLVVRSAGWYVIYPQFINPANPTVLDVRFRAALWHAIDRQTLNESIGSGLAPVADMIVTPEEPEYRELGPYVVRHDYDPRRTSQLFAELGFQQGSDGLRDSRGERLTLETTSTADPLNSKNHFSVADYWQSVGIQVNPTIIPLQRAQDQELRAKFPNFEVIGQPNGVEAMRRVKSAEARTAERRYTGQNNAGYMNPELDGLIDRYFTTVPWTERIQVGGQIIRHMTSQVVWLGLYYRTEPTLYAKRIKNFSAGPQGYTQAWNAHLWDL